jgi:hypothetical protein
MFLLLRGWVVVSSKPPVWEEGLGANMVALNIYSNTRGVCAPVDCNKGNPNHGMIVLLPALKDEAYLGFTCSTWVGVVSVTKNRYVREEAISMF